MKTKVMILSALILAGSVACQTKKTAVVTEQDELSGMLESVQENKGFIEVDKAYQGPAKGDAFNIGEMKIIGDSLYVNVEYSGGCKTHDFKMITHGNFLKSLPPKLPLFLEHKANEDNCRALKTEQLAFDLKPLRNPQTKKVKVFVNDQQEKALDYEYK
jgi:NigD-like C-terminal beta sandwich domain